MISRQTPLKYKISSWSQLPQCMSNNSRCLHLHVSNILNDDRLSGTLIKIDHEAFGTLFACLVNGSGPLLSEDATNHIPELSTQQILAELKKFGFEIQYNPEANLAGDQIAYLMTLNQLGYDKIRILNVYEYADNGSSTWTPTVVAFKIKNHGDWLNNGYSASSKEVCDAFAQGTAINISAISQEKRFRWDWLLYVASIEDILKDNM